MKELIEGLDDEIFWQVHRGTIINANAIDRAVREGREKLAVNTKGHKQKLPLSRQYFHLLKPELKVKHRRGIQTLRPSNAAPMLDFQLSILMFESLTTLPHFAISDEIKDANSFGDWPPAVAPD